MYELQLTSQFRKDCKRMKRRGLNMRKLTDVIDLLQAGKELPPTYHDHSLSGDYAGFRECHINPDWLLVYYVQADRLVLVCVRTGSHGDIFG